MTECPSCRTVHEGQPKFCENCGCQFASDPKANSGFFQKRLTPTQQWILGAFTVGMALLVALSIESLPENPTNPPPSSMGDSNRPTTPARPMTPLQKKVKEATEYWEEEKRAEAAWPEPVRKAELGVITTIVGPGASWPCASSKVALKELMKWHKASLAEPDSAMNDMAFEHLTDTLMRTRSIMVEPRERVKILEKEPGIRKVSVIEHKGSYGFAYMSVTARGCWMASEAVVR